MRDTERPDPNDSDDSEVIINRNESRRRRSRSREMVNIPRTELSNLYEEMRHLRNEVDRMKKTDLVLVEQDRDVIGTVLVMLNQT